MSLKEIWNNVKLSFLFAKQELKERYVGTNFGQLWLIISPIITIGIYTIIFTDFMQMKMNITNNKYAYSIYLIPGLLSWNFFSSVISRFSNLLFEKASIFKKIAVPIYIFFLSVALAEAIIYIISIILGILFLLLVNAFYWKVITIFYFIFLLFLFSVSIGTFIALLSPFFKDLREIVSVVLQLWFWMTPIIYLKEMLADKLPWLVDINLLYYFIEPMQKLFLNQQLSLKEYYIPLLIVSIFFISAGWFYKKVIGEIKDIV